MGPGVRSLLHAVRLLEGSVFGVFHITFTKMYPFYLRCFPLFVSLGGWVSIAWQASMTSQDVLSTEYSRGVGFALRCMACMVLLRQF